MIWFLVSDSITVKDKGGFRVGIKFSTVETRYIEIWYNKITWYNKLISRVQIN